ncbi:hypothetical protein Tco_1053962 [Tanacetum coccineum]|uniref:Uncharacterized protein n=1 Tax=Tanacetum coccineum TaxID=301880 RepID=A0ABQ5GX01_9ASTR
MKMLQARENLMEAIQAFLKKYDQIPPKEKSMALLLAEERFLKIKKAVKEEQNQPENIQELLLKLINDLQILNGIQLKQEEQTAKDEFFDPGGDIDEIEFLLHHDPSTPKISIASILEGFTDQPPLEENDDLFNLESKENKWKKILYDAPIDDLMTEDKVFDHGIPEKIFPPTYVSLPFKDRHYFSLTFVIRISSFSHLFYGFFSFSLLRE